MTPHPNNEYEVELEACPNSDYDHIPDDIRGHIRIVNHMVEAQSISQACAIVRDFIRDNQLGSGNWAGGLLYKGGIKVGYISYNGKYWANPCPKKNV